MPSSERKGNRGPAAAEENRRALLAAAHRVFTERGYHAPLSAVAAEAGVGQGVLYRHFPTRLDLAIAVFDTHWEDYERLSADPAPDAFERLWRLLVERTVTAAAFVEMAVDARHRGSAYDGPARLRALLGPPLDRARSAGAVPADLTVDDVLLAQRMVYGIVVTAVDGDVRAQIRSALAGISRLPAP